VEERIQNQRAITTPVRLADIDVHALDVRWRTWTHPHWSGSGGWNWDDITRSVLRRPSAFRVAVWSGDRLLALAVGRASKRLASGRHQTLSLHFIESHPDRRHPLRNRILGIIFNAAEEYGRAIGATRLRLVDPLPGSAPLYLHVGFGIAGRYGQHVYLERPIGSHVPRDGDQA
jgi:hypothetical protein